MSLEAGQTLQQVQHWLSLLEYPSKLSGAAMAFRVVHLLDVPALLRALLFPPADTHSV